MILDRSMRYVQFVADFPAGVAESQQVENLSFPRRDVQLVLGTCGFGKIESRWKMVFHAAQVIVGKCYRHRPGRTTQPAA
jgi:hypothetical protein